MARCTCADTKQCSCGAKGKLALNSPEARKKIQEAKLISKVSKESKFSKIIH